MTNYLRTIDDVKAHARTLTERGIYWEWINPTTIEVTPRFAPTYYLSVMPA
jgi:hypothetical protein